MWGYVELVLFDFRSTRFTSASYLSRTCTYDTGKRKGYSVCELCIFVLGL